MDVGLASDGTSAYRKLNCHQVEAVLAKANPAGGTGHSPYWVCPADGARKKGSAPAYDISEPNRSDMCIDMAAEVGLPGNVAHMSRMGPTFEQNCPQAMPDSNYGNEMRRARGSRRQATGRFADKTFFHVGVFNDIVAANVEASKLVKFPAHHYHHSGAPLVFSLTAMCSKMGSGGTDMSVARDPETRMPIHVRSKTGYKVRQESIQLV